MSVGFDSACRHERLNPCASPKPHPPRFELTLGRLRCGPPALPSTLAIAEGSSHGPAMLPLARGGEAPTPSCRWPWCMDTGGPCALGINRIGAKNLAFIVARRHRMRRAPADARIEEIALSPGRTKEYSYMGKASRKKKVIREDQTDGSSILRSSKESLTSNIKNELQKAPSKGTWPLAIISILLVSCAVYFNSLFDDFVYDDIHQVVNNPWITDIRYIPRLFSTHVWAFLPSVPSTNYYRPMMHLIYMITYHIFGLAPWGFHLVNVLFHAGVSLLAFIIVSRLLRESHRVPSPTFRLSWPHCCLPPILFTRRQ